MRILLLNSLLLLVTGCSRSPYLQLEKTSEGWECLNSHKPDFTTILYNTHVNVTGNHLSGILLFKKFQDDSIRVVFSNEMGVKFFDFEFTGNHFKVHYIMSKLNRKPVINQLRKNIGFLIMHRVNAHDMQSFVYGNERFFRCTHGKELTYYITDASCDNLVRIENASPRKTKIIVYLTPYQSGMADSVYINHQSFEFNISMKQIKR
jgi:hypothetical protein